MVTTIDRPKVIEELDEWTIPGNDYPMLPSDYMKELGHSKGWLVGPGGEVCLWGAAMCAFGEDPWDGMARKNDDANTYVRELGTWLGRHAIYWNNEPERSADEIVNGMLDFEIAEGWR
jgi:hypothetical protein